MLHRSPVFFFAAGRTLVALVAAQAGSGVARAQSEPAEGLRWGPWILSPYVAGSYERSDNVFLRTSESARSDTVRRVAAGLASTLRFSNSELALSYESSRHIYEETGAAGEDLSHQVGLDLNLVFSTGVRLQLSEQYTRGISDIQRINEGGELTFEGERFDGNAWTVDLQRDVAGTRGYAVRVGGDRVDFEAERDVPYFDARGLNTSLEYREPLNSRTWISATYQGRRADQFDALAGSERQLREESRDAFRIGVRGRGGRGQTYWLQVGGERFTLQGDRDVIYSGLSVDGQWRLLLGTRSALQIGLSRRALPSYLGTYYLVQPEVRVHFDRRWARYSTVGVVGRYSSNGYGERLDLDEVPGVDRSRRKDRIGRVEAFVEFRPVQPVGFRFGVLHQRRGSNYDESEFKNTVVSSSLVLGWRGR
jgi:hypothetical protein